MGLLDKKGKLFGLINIIDLAVIILLIVALAAGLYVYKGSRPSDNLPTTPIEIDIELVVSKEQADAIQIGQTVVDNQKGAILGTIKDMKVTEQVGVFGDSVKGQFVESVVPGKYNVVITLNSEAVVEPDRITISGLEINIGRPAYIKCGFIGSGFFIGMRIPE